MLLACSLLPGAGTARTRPCGFGSEVPRDITQSGMRTYRRVAADRVANWFHGHRIVGASSVTFGKDISNGRSEMQQAALSCACVAFR